MTLIQSFQKLISYKKYPDILSSCVYKRSYTHTSSSKTAAPAEAFFVWYSAESELWSGTGFHITLPVTTGVRIGDSWQDDLLVGIPEAGRGDPRLQKIIGFFVPLGKNMTNIQAKTVAQKI